MDQKEEYLTIAKTNLASTVEALTVELEKVFGFKVAPERRYAYADCIDQRFRLPYGNDDDFDYVEVVIEVYWGPYRSRFAEPNPKITVRESRYRYGRRTITFAPRKGKAVNIASVVKATKSKYDQCVASFKTKAKMNELEARRRAEEASQLKTFNVSIPKDITVTRDLEDRWSVEAPIRISQSGLTKDQARQLVQKISEFIATVGNAVCAGGL